MIVYYSSGKKNQRVSEAFAAGCGAKLEPAERGYLGGAAVVYGWTRGLWDIARDAAVSGEDWYYIDNGYLGNGSHFRVSLRARQWMGRGVKPRGLERLNALGVTFRDRQRNDGGHILIATQTKGWYEFAGEGSRDEWVARVTAACRERSKRRIVVRHKEEKSPLDEWLLNCWAVVVHSSNVAIDALLAGLPAFTTAPCAAYRVANTSLGFIENPSFPHNRLHWAAHLAANQWTLDEMRSGACWRDLQTIE